MKTVVARAAYNPGLYEKGFIDVLAKHDYRVENGEVIGYIAEEMRRGMGPADLARICAREVPSEIGKILDDLLRAMPRKYFKRFSTKLRLILYPNQGFEMVMPHAESEIMSNRFDTDVFIGILCDRDAALRARIRPARPGDVRELVRGLLNDGVMPDEIITARIFACLLLKFGMGLKDAASARFLAGVFGKEAAELLHCEYCRQKFCKSCANCKIRD